MLTLMEPALAITEAAAGSHPDTGPPAVAALRDPAGPAPRRGRMGPQQCAPATRSPATVIHLPG